MIYGNRSDHLRANNASAEEFQKLSKWYQSVLAKSQSGKNFRIEELCQGASSPENFEPEIPEKSPMEKLQSEYQGMDISSIEISWIFYFFT
jgi:hypothetical protein